MAQDMTPDPDLMSEVAEEVVAEAEDLTVDVGADESTEQAPDHQDQEAKPAEDEAPVDPNAKLLVDGLGMSWAAFQLYPNPETTPSWERAMEMFRRVESYPVLLEVGSGAFTSEGDDVETTVDGATRMVRALFVHSVAAVALPAPPTEADLLRCYELLHEEPTEAAKLGGIAAVLANAGTSSIELIGRAALEESDESVEAGRSDDVREIVDGGLEPDELAARVMAEGNGEVDAVTERFTSWYEAVIGNVESEDFMAKEAVVTAFVEAFFHLRPEFKLAILEYCLATRTKPEFQTLLDQFSGHELAAMASDLSDSARTELSDYARVSVDEGRPDEILDMLQPANVVDQARRAVADRIAELLDDDSPQTGRGATFARLRSELVAIPAFDGMGRRVLRDLMAVEERDSRFRRLLRVWTGKVARALHGGDLEDAEAWFDAGLENPTYPDDRQAQVDDALDAMATDHLVETLVEYFGGGVAPPVVMRLIEAWGTTVTRRLVERLAEDEDPGHRRALIDALGVVCSQDVTALFPYLTDERWYLVRNLVIALGKTSRPEAAGRLKSLAAKHRDHRVRVEALRSLTPVSPKQAVESSIRSLRDEHKRVRQAALALLAAADGELVEDAIAEAVDSRDVSTEVKLSLVSVLSERSGAAATAILQRMAARRSIFGRGRALKQAAQEALKGRS